VWSPPCARANSFSNSPARRSARKRLGWARIDCIEIEDNALTAELWEIAENLYRCDLTKEQRDEHIRRYAELLEAQEAAVISQQSASKLKTDANPKGAGRSEGTASKIARATGLSKDTVRRALNPPKPRSAPPTPKRAVDVTDDQFRALMSAWNHAGPDYALNKGS